MSEVQKPFEYVVKGDRSILEGFVASARDARARLGYVTPVLQVSNPIGYIGGDCNGKTFQCGWGAMTLFLGLILWILFSVLGGIEHAVGHFNPTLYAAMTASFFLMIFGPVLFWIVLMLIVHSLNL